MNNIILSKIQDTVLFTGTQKLLQDLTTALILISIAITLVLAVKDGIEWGAADEQERPVKQKKIIWTIIIGVITVVITGIVKVVLGYYGVSVNTAMAMFTIRFI